MWSFDFRDPDAIFDDADEYAGEYCGHPNSSAGLEVVLESGARAGALQTGQQFVMVLCSDEIPRSQRSRQLRWKHRWSQLASVRTSYEIPGSKDARHIAHLLLPVIVVVVVVDVVVVVIVASSPDFVFSMAAVFIPSGAHFTSIVLVLLSNATVTVGRRLRSFKLQ